jgi:glucose/arabinose dehydrogenase
LLGLAFDPGFGANRRFYVNYTADNPRRTVISRFTATDTRIANANTEEVLLEFDQPFANHNGGMIDFGSDNKLFIATGDGGSGGDPLNSGQDRTTLLGNILRIDVSGDAGFVVPPDNPFVGTGGGIREEIWAFGFRNPFRFSFDRQNGNLWLGDVGQSSREEIDLVTRGGNFGWRLFEGNLEFNNPEDLPASNFVAPVIDYDRNVGASVIGGYVYRGSKLPSLIGAYLYGDFISGRIFALVHDGQQVVSNTEVANVPNVSSFAEDRDGEVYAVSLNGQIFRFSETE